MRVDGTVQISIDDFDHLRETTQEYIRLINRLRETIDVSHEEGCAKINLNSLIPILEDIISDDITADYYLTRLPHADAVITLREYIDNDIPF